MFKKLKIKAQPAENESVKSRGAGKYELQSLLDESDSSDEDKKNKNDDDEIEEDDSDEDEETAGKQEDMADLIDFGDDDANFLEMDQM